MLSYGTEFNEKIGQKDKAQVIITQPQIINGGQTAFTLSRIYEENLGHGNLEELFGNKEVLLKVITFPEKEQEDNVEQLNLIEAISKATNQQTPVEEADRRSNDRIQIEIQNAIFNSFGYFYEPKRGEYADGIKAGYIKRSQIIERELFLRLCKSCDLRPSEARRSSLKVLFREDNFTNTLNAVGRHKEYFFAYLCYEMLGSLERSYSRDKNNKYGVATYGQALRYGKFAVVSACRLRFEGEKSLLEVESIVNAILGDWLNFESHVANLPSNSNYFRNYYDEDKGVVVQELNFDNYYKGRTVNSDLARYFRSPKKTTKR